jgi:tRNA-specific 2-thiouridylase
MAREVASRMDIPFYVIDAREQFKSQVVDAFVTRSYEGFTPNPCYLCNRFIRWGYLLEKALAMGADYFATGHYAKVIQDSNGIFHLKKGDDPVKDQSYVLSGLSQSQLSKTIFPLGKLMKEDVRDEARRRKLPVADKPDSQDLCFVGRLDYREFLNRYGDQFASRGKIVNTAGKVIGTHNGLQNYTIGQRKGIGSGNREPVYVIEKNSLTNELVIGSSSDLQFTRVYLANENWICGDIPEVNMEYEAKIRYKAWPQSAKLSYADNRYAIEFASPVRDATPGQIVVIYDGDEVVGSGEIIKTERGNQ